MASPRISRQEDEPSAGRPPPEVRRLTASNVRGSVPPRGQELKTAARRASAYTLCTGVSLAAGATGDITAQTRALPDDPSPLLTPNGPVWALCGTWRRSTADRPQDLAQVVGPVASSGNVSRGGAKRPGRSGPAVARRRREQRWPLASSLKFTGGGAGRWGVGGAP